MAKGSSHLPLKLELTWNVYNTKLNNMLLQNTYYVTSYYVMKIA